MSHITLHTDSPATTTCVPNAFIDDYMISASGEYVKIYLYLLRCINGNKNELSISKMADKFEHTEKDIKRALKYWEKMNLLRLEYNAEGELESICFQDSSENVPAESGDGSDTCISAAPAAPATPKRREYSLDEISDFSKKEEVKTLFFVAERYMRHPLTSNDFNTILYWYDT